MIKRWQRPQNLFHLNARKAAFVIIDMQNFACAPASGGSMPRIGGVIAQINRMADFCREKGIPVIWVRQNIASAGTSDDAGLYSLFHDPRRTKCTMNLGPGTDIYPAMHMDAARDRVVLKNRYSAFRSNPETLRGTIDSLKRTQLIVAGVAANVCVESTVRDAMQLDYEVVLVSDGVTAPDEGSYASALKNIRLFFGDVRTAEEIMGELAHGEKCDSPGPRQGVEERTPSANLPGEKPELLENRLARFVSGITARDLDPAMVHLLKRNFLDSYAGICASLQDQAMLVRFDRLTSLAPTEEGLTVWGLQRKASVPDAIFMNTILGRRSDLVNTYMAPNGMGGSHPSDNVSLVLSMADWLGKNSQDVLVSTYIAYLLSCAFADYYNPERNAYDHDAQALFYLPLIIGHMLGLSVPQMTEAQRIAGTMGLDINQAALGEVTDWKHCTYASCAVRALQAVKLAQAGFEGPREIYEGEAGINRFIPHGDGILDPLPALGSIIFKRWPALVFCQTPIDVAVDIAGQIEDPRDIEHVEVYTYRKAIEEAALETSYHPVSRAGRTHSLPYCVAAALVKKTIEYNHFDDDFTKKETDVAELLSKITIVEDECMTRAFPDGAPCKIIVTMKDGKRISRARDYPHGDPHDPLGDQEIEAKARLYLTPLAGPPQAEAIIRRIWTLEEESSVRWLIEPLCDPSCGRPASTEGGTARRKPAIADATDIQRFFDAFNNRDLNAISTFMSEDCVWNAAERRLEGRQNIIDYWRKDHAAFKETLGKPEKIVFGDHTVYLQVKIHLSFLGDGTFYGKTYKKGESLDFACADFYELNAEGKIKSGCVYTKFNSP